MGELSIVQTPGTISYDFESTRKMLEEKLKEYNGAVFTEESKGVAKKTVAELRSQKKEVEKRIREVKKEWMIPFDAFEKDAKELVGLYDEPINFINDQVKGFEEQRKQEKVENIKKLYNDTIPDDIKVFLPLAAIFNDRWTNATYKLKDIGNEFTELANGVTNDIRTIKAMHSEDETDALKAYQNNLRLIDAISLINERAKVREDAIKREKEQQQREAEERARKEERDRIKAEQEKEQAEQQKAEELQIAAEEAQQEIIENLTPDASGEVMFYDYTIMLTKDAKEKLEMYMDSVGIEYIER